MFLNTLKFNSVQLESEFSKSLAGMVLKLDTVILLILCSVSITLSVVCYVDHQIVKGTVFIVLAVLFFLAFIKETKMRRIIPHISIILGLALLVLIFAFSNASFDELTTKQVFYEGYILGIFSGILQRVIPQHHINAVFTVGIVLIRFATVPPDNIPQAVIMILFDIGSILIAYFSESQLRTQLKTTNTYRSDLSKFKTLLTSHLPENIIILSRGLDRKFLVTNSFATTFKAEGLGQIKSFLSSLTISVASFGSNLAIGDTSLTTALKQHTLLDYLNFYKNEKSNSEHITSFTVEGSDMDKNKLTYEVKIFHLNWDDSDAVTIILNDLSQQETLLALKLADENKDKVLATVSHELRTPIHGMLGITQIIEQEFDDPKLLSYCKTAKVCSKMLLNLVNSILDLSQIRHNCIQLKPTQFKLADMLEEIKFIFQPQFSSKTVDFRVELGEDIPEKIISDRNRLTQVIVNLLANAHKFTFHGEVVLKLAHSKLEDEIEFSVRDTGVGIRDKDKAKLFKMYGRLQHLDSTLNSQGAGLGLTISNNLAKLLNPKKQNMNIELVSVQGEGSTFSFSVSTKLSEFLDVSMEMDSPEDPSSNKNILQRFQLRKHQSSYSESMAEFDRENYYQNLQKSNFFLSADYSPSLATTTKSKKKKAEKSSPLQYKTSPSQSLGSTKALLETCNQFDQKHSIQHSIKLFTASDYVLAVDDNPFNLMIVTKLMEKWGFSVVTALNGEEAIAKAKEQDKSSFFKMILMDCQMPIMDGFQATKSLRELMEKGEIPEVPIFAVTANDTKKDQEECIKVGMSAHLSKPLKEEALQKLVDKFLG